MAKRFKDIHGVLLSETYTDGRGEKTTKETYFGYDNKNYHYDIKSYGDTLYMLDRNNNFEIVELLVKQKSMNYHGFATISAVKLSDAENVKEYIKEKR